MGNFDHPSFLEVSTDRMEQELSPQESASASTETEFVSLQCKPDHVLDSIELSRTVVDDHLIPAGFRKNVTRIASGPSKDCSTDFPHDLMASKFKRISRILVLSLDLNDLPFAPSSITFLLSRLTTTQRGRKEGEA